MFEIETARMVILREIKLGDNLGSWDVVLIDNGRRAVVGNFTAKTLSFVDLVNWTFVTVPVGGAPARMSVIPSTGGDWIYVPRYDRGDTVRVRSDMNGSGSIIGERIVTNAGGFDSGFDGQKVFVSYRDGKEIVAIDPATSTVVDRWPVPTNAVPFSIAASTTGEVFSTHADKGDDKLNPEWADHPNSVFVKNSRNGSSREYPVCDSGPDGGEIMSDGTSGFFIACSGEGVANWYNADGSLRKSFTIGATPFGLAFDQVRRILYVGVKGWGTIAKILIDN